MIRSMTGYGRAEKSNEHGKITVEISSLNRRSLEIFVNLPDSLQNFEQSIRDTVGKFAKRGKLQIRIHFESVSSTAEFVVDIELAKRYADALETLCEELELEDDITLKDVLACKDVLSFEQSEQNVEAVEEILNETLIIALEEMNEMRGKEGAHLQEDIIRRLNMIEVKVKEIQSLGPLALQRYETRIKKRLQDLLVELPNNEDRVMREVALMAERLDVTEEIVRMQSHSQQFFKTFESDDSVGRLLDFIIQEMFREMNTIASKSNDLEISRLSVEVRNELDKIREQIQNIE